MNGTAGKSFRTSITVRYAHCDTAGIVYYPRFHLMMAEVVERWFDAIGCDYRHLHVDRREGIPAVRTECDFLRPSRLGDRLEFVLEVERLGRSSFSLAIRARDARKDEDRLRARLVLVWSRLYPGPEGRTIPVKYRAAMEQYLSPHIARRRTGE